MGVDAFEILVVLGLILLNGVFSMSEMALVSSKKVRLEAGVKAGARGAKAALELYSSPTRFLSTVQIGITLIGLLTGIYSGESLTSDLKISLAQIPWVQPMANELAVTIVLISITFCSLVLGELIPKRIGLRNPEGISRVMAPFMKVLSSITFPFVWVLTHTSDFLLALFNLKASKAVNITEEEIKAIIKEGTLGGEIQKIEQDIVERVFALGDRKIASLMTTRSDLTFINLNDDFDVIRETVNSDLHRIYPVYDADKDAILGVVLLRDLFIGIQSDAFSIRSCVKPAHYLAESTSAYKALEVFKATKEHYAFVSNEYGLVLGIVTMDDILKALVGDVSEFNQEDYAFYKRQGDSWLVEGQYPMPEFLKRFEIENKSGLDTINTLAGLVLRELNHIPRVGEKIVWRGLEIEVVDMDNIKIDKLLVTRKR